ncbi:hypothetical protein RZS08_03185, partial [Arthrospira platensis SPKY1]|nr:hypothetical protein [Arthrospira platensis SPKY1]
MQFKTREAHFGHAPGRRQQRAAAAATKLQRLALLKHRQGSGEKQGIETGAEAPGRLNEADPALI